MGEINYQVELVDNTGTPIGTAGNPFSFIGGVGVGAMQLVPTASANGTALGTMPTNAIGARIYLAASDTVTFTIAASQPVSPPSVTYTISGASGGTGPNWDENLSNGQMIYVTSTAGTPKFRWF